MSDRAPEPAGDVRRNDFSGTAGNVLQVGAFSGAVHLHGSVPVIAQPRQLPSAPDGFTGRTEHVAELDALLRAEVPDDRPTAVVISAIGGTAGIGKTSLALYWAHKVADRFPDGQLYVNLRGFEPGSPPVRPAEALRGFLDALRIPVNTIGDELAEQAALFRSLLAQRRMLVVLDNARDADQVRPLLPGSPSCVVLVTSRNRLVGLAAREGARLITVNTMSTEEATALLAARLGQDRLAAEPAAAALIVEQCARLPLALAIIAARAAATPDFPLRVLAEELGDDSHRLDALDAGDALADIRMVFSGSYRALTDPAASAFRLLALHPGADIGLEAAAALTGCAAARTRTPFDELARANLLEEHSPGRYRFHDLVRLYARSLALTDEIRSAATRRLLSWYRDRVSAAVAWRDFLIEDRRPFTTYADAQRWLAEERGNLLAIVGDPTDPELDGLRCEIAWSLSRFLRQRRHLDDWQHMLAAALTCARRSGDAVRVAMLGLQQALATATGNPADPAVPGQIESSLALVASNGTPADQATALMVASSAHAVCGQVKAAQDKATDALALWQSIGSPRAIAAAWTALGSLRRRQLLFDEAMDCYRRAQAMWRDLADFWCEAETLMDMARADRKRTHVADAVEAISKARLLYAELGDPGPEAEALNLLGDILSQYGLSNQAYEAQQTAYHILGGLGEQRAEPQVLFAVLAGLVEAALARGQFDTCLTHLDQWVAAARELPDEEEEIKALVARGLAHQSRGNYSTAVTTLRQCRERARNKRAEIEGNTLVKLGVTCFEKGDIAAGRECLKGLVLLASKRPDLNYLAHESMWLHCVDYGVADMVQSGLMGLIEANRRLGDFGAECWQLDTLGLVYDQLGRYEDAIECYQRAIDGRARMGSDSYRRGWGLVDIAFAYQRSGRLDRALDYFKQALALRQEAGNRFGVMQKRYYVAQACITLRDFTQADTHVSEIAAVLSTGDNDRVLGAAGLIMDLVEAYTEQCRFADAEACYRHEAGYLRSHGSAESQRELQRVIAKLRLREGRGDEAVALLTEELDNAAGNLAAQTLLYNDLVDALLRQRRLREAEAAVHQGFRAADEGDTNAGRCRFLLLLAEVLRTQERFDEAIRHLSSALDLCRGNGDDIEATVLADLGRTYREAGRAERAVTCHQDSLAIRRRGQDARAVAMASAELARAYACAGRRSEAEDLLGESVALAGELEDVSRAAHSFGECARVAQALGRPEWTEEYFLRQAELSTTVVDLATTATALSDLGEYLLTVDQVDRAVDHHRRSLTTWRELGDPRGTAEQLRRLGLAQARATRHDDAVDSLWESLALAREMNDQAREADVVRALARIGTPGPRTEYERCLAVYEQLGDLAAARETAAELRAAFS